MTDSQTSLLAQIAAAPGVPPLVPAHEIEPRYFRDWITEAPVGSALALARPRRVAEVSATLAACHAHRVAVVPQGGRTGLAGGAVPVAGGLILSLERLNAIEALDVDSSSITVQAGVTMQAVQDAAQAAGLFFALDLGGRGSCQIGGNLSTNAGGNRVLRYGMARDLVLGIEAVLADGTVLSHLNPMLKDNTGYDLKHLFVGSEGTLGVVTRAVLKLHPQPRSTCTAMCSLPNYEAVLAFLAHVRRGLGPTLSAFEAMWPDFYDRMTEALPALPTPLPRGRGLVVLVEALGTDQDSDQARFEAVLAEAIDQAIVADAVIAQSLGEARSLWSVRDASGEFRSVFWPHVGFDVSVPTGSIGAFVHELRQTLVAQWADVETIFFGHVGDSNVHVQVKVGAGEQPESAIEETVYGVVGCWHGSVSAEHGIGLLKRPYLGHSRSPSELATMRILKNALDPRGILNPGKVLPA